MDNDKVKLRRYEDDLNVGGLGVIILAAWEFLKIIMYVLRAARDDFDLEGLAGDERAAAIVIIIAVVAVVVLLAFIILMIHMYIGMNASKAAKGEPYKKGYYKGAIILLIISVASMFAYIIDFKELDKIDTTIASFIVDLTSIYILWVVISSTRKIRELKSLHTQE